jgi:hypothetical protein
MDTATTAALVPVPAPALEELELQPELTIVAAQPTAGPGVQPAELRQGVAFKLKHAVPSAPSPYAESLHRHLRLHGLRDSDDSLH